MATAYIEFGSAFSAGISAGLHLGSPASSEKVAITSSNAVSTKAASGGLQGGAYSVVRILSDVDTWIATGSSPDAAVAPRRALFAGQSIELLIGAGDKVAVKALD